MYDVQAATRSGVHRVTGVLCRLAWVNTTAVRTCARVDVMTCSVLECASKHVRCTAFGYVHHCTQCTLHYDAPQLYSHCHTGGPKTGPFLDDNDDDVK